MIRERIGPAIVPGRVYRSIADLPRGCKGGLYQVEDFILDVPSYQEKVLVRCIEGKDRGLRFSCTPSNFALRYKDVPDDVPLAGEQL